MKKNKRGAPVRQRLAPNLELILTAIHRQHRLPKDILAATAVCDVLNVLMMLVKKKSLLSFKSGIDAIVYTHSDCKT